MIFTAQIRAFDDDYASTAARMRERAFSHFGCAGFHSCCENGLEIAVSYWPSREHIRAWAADPEHRAAKALGKQRWYGSHRVEIVEIQQSYGDPAPV